MSEVGTMLRVETPASILLGSQQAALLQRIRETGSIAAAGRLMGMNYNQAWYKVHTLNVAAYKSLMTTIVGGKAGGVGRNSLLSAQLF